MAPPLTALGNVAVIVFPETSAAQLYAYFISADTAAVVVPVGPVNPSRHVGALPVLDMVETLFAGLSWLAIARTIKDPAGPPPAGTVTLKGVPPTLSVT